MPRRVIVELKSGAQVAGELVEVVPIQSQKIIDGDKIRVTITKPGIILKRRFANAEFYTISEIAFIHEVSLESQLK